MVSTKAQLLWLEKQATKQLGKNRAWLRPIPRASIYLQQNTTGIFIMVSYNKMATMNKRFPMDVTVGR